MTETNSMTNFKQCPKCTQWLSARDIIEGEGVAPIGMRFDDEDSTLNLYFFIHVGNNCQTTFTIGVEKFLPFITEPVPATTMSDGLACEGRCLNLSDHSTCKQKCTFAPFRRFLQTMLRARRNLSAAQIARARQVVGPD